MASKEQLRKVALRCDEYNAKQDESSSLKSSYEELYETCTNCIHYNEHGHCELDLIDKTLSSMSMELDLKS